MVNMTKYIIIEGNDVIHEGNTIIETFTEWIKREIEIIKESIIEDENCNHAHIKAINKLNNINLVECNGRKQFNNILNIINDFEGSGNNINHLMYVEV
ncbi:hypothetical protein HB162lentus_01490 [Mammaliicoccus lentus]